MATLPADSGLSFYSAFDFSSRAPRLEQWLVDDQQERVDDRLKRHRRAVASWLRASHCSSNACDQAKRSIAMRSRMVLSIETFSDDSGSQSSFSSGWGILKKSAWSTCCAGGCADGKTSLRNCL